MSTITIPKFNSKTGEGTLSYYARQNNTSVKNLTTLNKDNSRAVPDSSNPNLIREGGELIVPDRVGATQSTASYRSQNEERAAKLEEIKASALEIQDKINTQRESEKSDKTKTTTPTDTGAYDPFGKLELKANEARDTYESDRAQMEGDYDRLQMVANKEHRALIDSIKSTFSARIGLMEDTNSRVLAAKNVNNIRSGTSRYLPEMAAGLMTEEEQTGHLRVADLEAQMTQLISAAATAKAEGDTKLFNAVYDQIDTAYDNMQSTLDSNFDMAVSRNKEIRANNQELRQQEVANEKSMLERSERSAPALASKIADLPESQQIDVIEAYAEQSGIPLEVLMGDIAIAAQKSEYKGLQVQNLENQITNRNRTTNIAQSRETRLSQEKKDEESGLTDDTSNIISGVSTITDVADKDLAKVKAELREAGFYEENPPGWFIDMKNDEAGQTVVPAKVKEDWSEYRISVVGN